MSIVNDELMSLHIRWFHLYSIFKSSTKCGCWWWRIQDEQSLITRANAQLKWDDPLYLFRYTQWIWMSAPFKWLMVDTWNTFINRLRFFSLHREQRPQTGRTTTTTTMASAATDCAKLRNIEMQNKSQMKKKEPTKQQQKRATRQAHLPITMYYILNAKMIFSSA